MDSLIKEIINCDNITLCKDDKFSCPCKKIVTSQNVNSQFFQVPEPWNGNIKQAKILFISSNPSINENEEYPDTSWKPELVEDFFTNRFNGKIKKWVKDNKYVLLKNGCYNNKHVPFWSSIIKRTEEILGTNHIISNDDFCITEIVKCKSTKEYGVEEALEECSKKYLRKVLGYSGARLIIVLGSKMKNVMLAKYPFLSVDNVEWSAIEGLDRIVIFLPHPTSWEKNKTVLGRYGKENIERIRNELRSRSE